MNTHTSADPRYIDLARAGATIERSIAADACTRLGALVQDLQDGHARLHFQLTKEGEVVVNGVVSMRCQVDCHLCLLPQEVELHADVTGLIVSVTAGSTAATNAADQLRNQPERQIDWDAQPILVSTSHLNVSELVEDELLLHVPSQVCRDKSCPQRPPMAFGARPVASAAGGSADNAAASAENYASNRPFAVLRQLTNGADATSRMTDEEQH